MGLILNTLKENIEKQVIKKEDRELIAVILEFIEEFEKACEKESQ